MTDERIQTGDLVAADDADAPIARDEPDAGAESPQRLEPLFEPGRERELRERWHALQARFVDEPQDTVSDADSLVEQQWSSGGDVSTEDLRLTLQRYRSFFERLLVA
jgi:hypothetical protein